MKKKLNDIKEKELQLKQEVNENKRLKEEYLILKK